MRTKAVQDNVGAGNRRNFLSSATAYLGLATLATQAGAQVPEGSERAVAGSSCRPEQFGAVGGAQRQRGIWQGHDDTSAIRAAIDHLEQRGGGDLVLSQKYFCSPQSAIAMTVPIGAGISITYSFLISRNIRLIFEGEGGFVSATNPSGASPHVCLLADSSDRFIRDVAIFDGSIEGFTIGIASFRNTCAIWRISGTRFNNCALAFYGNSLEQCAFSDLVGVNCGSLIVVGGCWIDEKNEIKEPGGYTDKCTFNNLRLESSWSLSGAAPFDTWFDDNVFRSSANASLVKTSAASPATAYRYSGACGFCVRSMARYARPSNSNVFSGISHAGAMRSAIRLDAGRTNVALGVYAEDVGYADPGRRRLPFGAEAQDPYLGPGASLPSLVSGVDVVLGLNLQFCVAKKATDAPTVLAEGIAFSKIG
jgi:hypothetical protein